MTPNAQVRHGTGMRSVAGSVAEASQKGPAKGLATLRHFPLLRGGSVAKKCSSKPRSRNRSEKCSGKCSNLIPVLLALIAALPSHAETCKPPDVPRVVIDNRSFCDLPACLATHSDRVDVVLACPVEGPCSYKAVVTPSGPQNVICLTPEAHQAALERAQ